MKKSAVIFLVLAVCFSQVLADDSTTHLNIAQVPPELVQIIPNQTWAIGTSFNNAFDLDDYFQDLNGDVLNFSVAGNVNIQVSINGTSHLVSFSQPLLFTGTEYAVFTATDGTFNVSSNNVSLTVVNDSAAPTWSSPQKSRATVFQSDIINFSTAWQDNVALSGFVLSLNQGGGWVNYSGSFSGQQNTSIYAVQIQYPAGSVVYWRYYANDTSGNLNGTDVYNFTVSAKVNPPSPPSGPPPGSGQGSPSTGIGEIVSSLFSTFQGTPSKEKEAANFSVEPQSFSLKMKPEETRTVFLKVYNSGGKDLNFSVEVFEIERFLAINEKNFALKSGETKVLTIDVRSQKEIPDLYFGSIIVSAENETRKVPLALQIIPIDIGLEMTVKVYGEYASVRPGNNVTAKIEIKSIKDQFPISGELTFAIKNFEGLVIDTGQEPLSFQHEITLNRTLTVPADATLGDYFFYGRFVFNNSSGLDSDLFQVGSLFRFASTIRKGLFYLYFILMMVIVLLLYMRYQRNKRIQKALNLYLLLNELKSYMDKGEIEKAAQLYIKIKSFYKENRGRETIENKEELKKKIEELVHALEEKNQKERVADVKNPAVQPKGEDAGKKAKESVQPKGKEDVPVSKEKSKENIAAPKEVKETENEKELKKANNSIKEKKEK